jgi:hypothetical protein
MILVFIEIAAILIYFLALFLSIRYSGLVCSPATAIHRKIAFKNALASKS